MKIVSSFFLTIALALYSSGQNLPNASTLSLKEIMKGNEFIGHQPENVIWKTDGTSFYFDWNPENNPGNSTYEYNIKTQEKAKINPSSTIPYDKKQHSYSSVYFVQDGALKRYDKKTKTIQVVYQSSSVPTGIQRSNDPEKVFFRSGVNLFCFNPKNASFIQLTNFLKTEASVDEKDTSYLTLEEKYLFQYIKDQENKKQWYENENKPLLKLPKEIYLGKDNLENLQISPNEQFISFRLSNYPKEKETEVEHHISDNAYAYIDQARAKVGAPEPSHRLGIYNVKNDTVYYISFASLSDIRKKPAYLNDPTPYDQERKIVMHSLKFNSNSSQAVCDVRAYDNKDRWIILIDLATGKFIEIDHQHDEAWIGGPGINEWNTEEGTLGWLKDNSTIYFQSEKTGYSHLYAYNVNTKSTSQLTSGNWEVHQVILSNSGESFYLTCNRSHPGNRDFIRYDITAKKMVPILIKDGFHEVILSPDEKTLAVRYSYKNKPWELFTATNVNNSVLIPVTHSTTKNFNSYKWREPEVIKIKASDGVDVYARLYKNSETQGNPAVIFVHGAGYLQNAHNYWSNYYREYMFHNFLVDNGFTVLDIDYRASEGYGRDYRTAIYREMGGRDLQDHLDGKDYLVKELGIDSTRIGIYGGSYGGFITLMAMLKTPGEFPSGAALRSVTDWAHYNHEYTSNILNYPATDPEAYKRSSPIYYAHNLEGKLIMLHGMVDDNVQFQDVVRLSQRFIELGKEDWELAVFPVEAHGFKESYSWYDEYRRIYELFYENLLK